MIPRLLAMFGALSLLAGCGDQFPDYHYKMTIYAGGNAFSSVRGIEQREVSSMVDSAGVRVERTLTGEAVVLDQNGQTYYALLTKPDNAEYATLIPGAALAPFIEGPASKSEVAEAIGEVREERRRASDPGYYLDDMAARSRAMTEVEGAKDLPRRLPARNGKPAFEAWPMFVTFGDPADPKTVREVSPDAIGVERITIEITDEAVTSKIGASLPWLVRYFDRMLDGNRLHRSNDLANNLSMNAFSNMPEN